VEKSYRSSYNRGQETNGKEFPTPMKHYFDSIREKLQTELTRSGMGYLKSGLELFHNERRSSLGRIEPAIGNLAIAVELMLKTFVVKNNPLLLFRELPLELRILFTCPDAIPSKGFNWRRYDIDLRSFNYKTLELAELISLFYVFFPNHKQALKPYFSLLSRCRNASIHSSLPSFQRYELERTAYLALRVFKVLDESQAFRYRGYLLKEEDKQFLSSFEEERTERVRKKIDEAKEKSKALAHGQVGVYIDSWDAYTTSCPICGCDGVLTGGTEVDVDVDEEGSMNPYLVFLAETFKCEECGLSLDDVDELKLAGMDISYDRPQSDMDKWAREEAEEAGFEDFYYGYKDFDEYYKAL